MPVDIRIVADVSHERVVEEAFVSVDHGQTFDYDNSDCYVDALNRVCMCTPLPLTKEWRTNTTGLYARKDLNDFTGFTVGEWAETELMLDGNYYLAYKGTSYSFSRYLTVETYRPNPSMYLSIGNYNAGNEVLMTYEFGWCKTPTDEPIVKFELWSNGRVFVYRSGVLVKKGSLGSFRGAKPNHSTELADYGEESSDLPVTTLTADMPSERNFIDLFIVTGMENEMLVFGNGGEGFDVTFDLGSEEDVIPDGYKFYFKPVDGKPTIQVANCNFAPTAIIYTKPQIAEAPINARRIVDIQLFWSYRNANHSFIYGSSTKSTIKVDFSGPWRPDGTSDRCRTKIVLTAGQGQTRTPFLYASMLAIGGISMPTPSQEVDLKPYVKDWTFTVDGSGNYAKLSLNLINALGLSETLGQTLNDMTPIALSLNGRVIFVGSVVSYELDDSNHNPYLATAKVEVVDSSFLLGNFSLSDTLPLDGLTLEQAIETLTAAYSSVKPDPQMRLINRNGTGGYVLEPRSTPSIGDFGFKIDRGDSLLDGLKKITDLFLIGGMWFIGPEFNDRNQYREVFYAWTRYQLPRTGKAIYRLYRSADEARRNGKDPLKNVFQSISKTWVPALFNRIVVTGRSSTNSNEPVQVVMNDYNSQWPGWARNRRPFNWKGFICKYGYYKSDIIGLSMATEVCLILYDELTQRKHMMEVNTFVPLVESPSNKPYWLGDRIWVQGRGTMMIRSITMHGKYFPDNPNKSQPTLISEVRTTYSGDQIAPSEGQTYDGPRGFTEWQA